MIRKKCKKFGPPTESHWISHPHPYSIFHTHCISVWTWQVFPTKPDFPQVLANICQIPWRKYIRIIESWKVVRMSKTTMSNRNPSPPCPLTTSHKSMEKSHFPQKQHCLSIDCSGIPEWWLYQTGCLIRGKSSPLQHVLSTKMPWQLLTCLCVRYCPSHCHRHSEGTDSSHTTSKNWNLIELLLSHTFGSRKERRAFIFDSTWMTQVSKPQWTE